MQVARLVALLVLVAGSAQAQELAGTFDQLRVLVKPGDTVTVTDSSGHAVRGRLIKLASDSLVLSVSGTPREFSSTDVDIIKKRGSDSLKNGALIGMAIGGGLATLGIAAAGVSSEDAGFALLTVLLYSGIGAGVGTGIDALIEGRRVIYASSTRPQLTVAPVLSGPRKGVFVSLRLAR